MISNVVPTALLLLFWALLPCTSRLRLTLEPTFPTSALLSTSIADPLSTLPSVPTLVNVLFLIVRLLFVVSPPPTVTKVALTPCLSILETVLFAIRIECPL